MGKTFLTNQINTSPTIVDTAAAAVDDPRGLFFKYDNNGKLVVASVAGEKVIGVGIITNAEGIKAGDEIDIQVSAIGVAKAAGTIAKGAEIMTDATGKATTATAGKFVVGTALEAAAAGQYFYFLIDRYAKAAQ